MKFHGIKRETHPYLVCNEKIKSSKENGKLKIQKLVPSDVVKHIDYINIKTEDTLCCSAS